MPRIKEYISSEKLTPNDQGYSAFETAGRRVGPLYNQAGQDIREQGRGVSDLFNENRFGTTAFLDEHNGVGVRVQGGGGRAARGGGGRGRTDNSTVNLAGQRVPYNGAGEISRGARALTGFARAGTTIVNPDDGGFAGDYSKKGGVAPIPEPKDFSSTSMFAPPSYPQSDVNDLMQGIGTGPVPDGASPPDAVMAGNMAEQQKAIDDSQPGFLGNVWGGIVDAVSGGGDNPAPAAPADSTPTDSNGDAIDYNPMN